MTSYSLYVTIIIPIIITALLPLLPLQRPNSRVFVLNNNHLFGGVSLPLKHPPPLNLIPPPLKRRRFILLKRIVRNLMTVEIEEIEGTESKSSDINSDSNFQTNPISEKI